MVAAPSQDMPDGLSFSLQSACSSHAAQLQLDPSSKIQVYKDIRVEYGCEPYIQKCSNRHLRRTLAQFRTGSHWLNIETGRHRGTLRENRNYPLCIYRVVNPGLDAVQFDSFDSDDEAADPIEDEYHAIFACSGYVYGRQLLQDLFSESISTVGQFLCQPNCNRVAEFLTWTRHMRLNHQPS